MEVAIEIQPWRKESVDVLHFVCAEVNKRRKLGFQKDITDKCVYKDRQTLLQKE